MRDRREGRCLCGAVRFAIADCPEYIGVCHCKMCQRWSSLAFAGVTVDPGQLSVQGGGHIGKWRSSDVSERWFCRTCGTPLWFADLNEDGSPASYDISAGTLDDTGGLSVSHEIFIDRKPEAYVLAGGHRRDTEAEYFRKIGRIPNPTEVQS